MFQGYRNYWDLIPTTPAPRVPGGPVAAVTWKNNVRVFYVAGRLLIEKVLSYFSEREGSWHNAGIIV